MKARYWIALTAGVSGVSLSVFAQPNPDIDAFSPFPAPNIAKAGISHSAPASVTYTAIERSEPPKSDAAAPVVIKLEALAQTEPPKPMPQVVSLDEMLKQFGELKTKQAELEKQQKQLTEQIKSKVAEQNETLKRFGLIEKSATADSKPSAPEGWKFYVDEPTPVQERSDAGK